MDSLNNRFKTFLQQLPSAESIDASKLPAHACGRKRADYLLADRKVILELKSLESDPDSKIHEELDKHRLRAEFPLFCGGMKVGKIPRHLPDEKQIMQRLIARVSNSVQKGLREANRQIESTKLLFGCPNAAGLLVFLNEDVTVLSPEIIAQRSSQLLTLRDPDGSYHYRHVACVWLLFENYSLKTQQASVLLPSILIMGPTADSDEQLQVILDQLQRAWAAFNHTPLHRTDLGRISGSDFVPLAGLGKQRQPLPRHELWRQQYQDMPYLRPLSDQALLAHGSRLFSLMRPSFLKGGPKLPDEMMNQYMERWTHFLEEMCNRGLDLKRTSA